MSSKLKLALIQTELIWESPKANREKFEVLLQFLPGESDLIVFPEMFTTGFSMNSAALAEPSDGTTVKWKLTIAQEKNSSVVGSIIVKEGQHYYNRLYWAFPNGDLTYYDKRHLFRMAGEDKYYSPGCSRLIVEYKGWKICPLICYDLRFPVWSRNDCDFDCLLYIANWPKPRIDAWTALLKARAIENQCFSIGINRIGQDGSGVAYSGGSVVFSPKGKSIATFKDGEEQIVMLELDKDERLKFREKFPVHLDRDEFKIEGL